MKSAADILKLFQALKDVEPKTIPLSQWMRGTADESVVRILKDALKK